MLRAPLGKPVLRVPLESWALPAPRVLPEQLVRPAQQVPLALPAPRVLQELQALPVLRVPQELLVQSVKPV